MRAIITRLIGREKSVIALQVLGRAKRGNLIVPCKINLMILKNGLANAGKRNYFRNG